MKTWKIKLGITLFMLCLSWHSNATNLPYAIKDPATSETVEYIYQQIYALNKIFKIETSTLSITIGDQNIFNFRVATNTSAFYPAFNNGASLGTADFRFANLWVSSINGSNFVDTSNSTQTKLGGLITIGSLGVGATPGSKFDVSGIADIGAFIGNTAGNMQTYLRNLNGDGAANLFFYDHNANLRARFTYDNQSSNTVIGSVGNFPFLFYTNSIERARIESNGDFFLGLMTKSTYTAASKNLELNGLTALSVLTSSGLTILGDSISDSITSNAGLLNFVNISTISLPLDSKISIGAATPAAYLDIAGSQNIPATIAVSSNPGGVTARIRNRADTGYSVVEFYSADNTDIGGIGYANPLAAGYTDTIFLGTLVNKPVLFINNNTERMRISGAITTGGALCLNASKVLTKCTSAVDASGNCTCP